MKKIYSFLFIAFLISFSSSAQVVGDYRSRVSGDWSDPATWETYNGTAWQTATSAPTAASGTISIRNTHTVRVAQPADADQLVIDNGGIFQVNNDLNLANGAGMDMIINGTMNFTFGVISGGGETTINNILNWSGGTLQTATTVPATGAVNFTPTNTAIVAAPFTNNGTVSWSTGDFTINNTAFTNNGNFNMGGTADDLRLTGSGSFVNSTNGTLTKTGVNLMNINIDFVNNGSINVQDGRLRNTGSDLKNAGIINISAGKTFQNISLLTFNSGTAFTGTGSLQLSASEALNSAITFSSVTTLFDGGEITGAAPLTINSIFNWTSGTLSCPTTVATSGIVNYTPTNISIINAPFTNNGTVNWSTGDFIIDNIVFTNNKSFNMSGTVDDLRMTGSGSFINSKDGTVTKSGTNLMNTDLLFTNNGNINVQDGKLRNTGSNLINAGTINIAAGKFFQNISVLNFNGGTLINGSGILQLTASEIMNGAVQISSTVTTLFDGGEITGSGPLTINGIMNWTTGTLSCITTVAPSGVINYTPTNITSVNANLVNNGTINWTSGDFMIGNSQLTNNATFTMGGTDEDLRLLGNGSFVNSSTGTVTKNNTNLMNINLEFTNNGRISVEDGKLRNTGSNLTNTGTIDIASGKVFQNTSSMNLNAGTVISGAGTFELSASEFVNAPLTISSSVITQLDAGELTGTGPLTFDGQFNWTTGTLSCTTTLSSTGVLNFSPLNVVSLNANFTNNGTVNWNNGDFPINSVFTNNNQFTVRGPVEQNIIGNGSFVNAASATYTKTTDIYNYINLPFANDGTMNGVGAVAFKNTFDNSGTIAPGAAQSSTTGSTIGVITFNGTPNPLTPTSLLDIEVANNLGSGTGNDEFRRESNLVLSGKLQVRETGVVLPGTFTIISVTTGIITGSFDSVILPTGYTLQQTPTTVTVTKGLGLPVTFAGIKAALVNNNIRVDWLTFNEQNISRYELEKSTDAVRFSLVGSVVATGRADSKGEYSYIDKTFVSGPNYYRIKIIEKDGRLSYSPIAKIVVGSTARLQAYPNPTTGVFTITGLSGNKNEISVIDHSGNRVRHYITNANSTTIDITNLPAGIYVLKIGDEVVRINKQ